ncbi:MAG: hypothetical protein RI885_2313 [Actinomycetota bacterium]
MDDAEIADTVIVPRRVAAPSVPVASVGPGGSDPLDDDTDTLLRARSAQSPVALVEPSVSARHSTPESTRLRRDSHAATLAPVPPVEHEAARYRYRINDGPIVDLDEVTLIGRKPRENRVPTAEHRALVTVASPSREVSSTHLELMQHGASIVVTDMRTTNGTRVAMPGAAPVVLLPGESVVAVPGTVIDIGDGNVIEILPMRRFVPAPDARAGAVS